MSLYGTRRYHAFQAEEGDEDLGEDEEFDEEGPMEGGEGEEEEEEEGITPADPTQVPETPAPPPPPAPSFDFQGITSSLTGLLQGGLGFFQNLDQGKFFILLGAFFLAIGMFSKKRKIGGLSTTVIFLLGFLLVLYGGISKFGGGAGLGGLLQQQ